MANEKRLIDANALIDEIDGIYQRHYVNSAYQFIHDFFRAVFRRIHKAPIVDAVEVVHGEWVQTTENLGWANVMCGECSACHETFVVDEEDSFDDFAMWKYCPNCGADMRGTEETLKALRTMGALAHPE